MPPTEQLIIDLPSDVADLVRTRMATGKYANESAVIREALMDTALPQRDISDPELEEWLQTVGVARYDAYDANPQDTFTAEQVLDYVHERLHPPHKAG